MIKRLYQTIGKRILDIVGVALASVFLLPVCLVVGVLVRWRLGRPVLFQQRRAGLNGVPFVLHKFRSMTDKTDASGQLLPDAQRLTTFGKFLRATSLDELPQLFNVLLGEMSLVGPRPLLVDYLERYDAQQARRHDTRPGVTGWAQVNGRNAISWERKFELDVWYVENQSFLLDLKILLMTVLKLFRVRDTQAEGHATMPEFHGTRSESVLPSETFGT